MEALKNEKSKKIDLKTDNNLRVMKIQRTCVHDGPGIRTTIFFVGCGLRCLWCQNPEALKFDSPEGKSYSIDEITETVLRDKEYYKENGGGVTLSGGEPLLQDSESLVKLLKNLKKENVNISVETTLNAPWSNISGAAPYIDLFIVDFKVIGDDILHKKITGCDSSLIQENLKKLLELKGKIRQICAFPVRWEGAEAAPVSMVAVSD
jgi:pyruvate formate lyase activating enzyme